MIDVPGYSGQRFQKYTGSSVFFMFKFALAVSERPKRKANVYSLAEYHIAMPAIPFLA